MTHINAPRIKQAEYVRNHWQANIEVEHKADDLLDPNYWSHVAMQMKARDEITAWSDDGSWYARFIVLDASRGWVKVHRIDFHELESKSDEKTTVEGYSVVWKGPHHKYVVLHEGNAEPLRIGFPTKTAGVRWVQDHVKSMAA
jgi:hypothetical protein